MLGPLVTVRDPVNNAAAASAALNSLALPANGLDKFLVIVDVAVERP